MKALLKVIFIQMDSGKWRFLFIPWIVIPFLYSASFSQEIPSDLQPSVETAVDHIEITIGDDITYTVTIRYDPTVTIETSTPGMELGQFEIKDVSIGDPERKGDRMVRTDHYILSTYFTGDYTIPPLSVRFRTSSGELGQVATDAIDIHVRSLTPEESEELTIRDIKPPLLVKGRSRWLMIALIVGVVLLLTMLAVWVFFLRRREKVAVTLEPPLPPHERALIAFERLRSDETLLAERRFKEFSTRLSEILRVYIHGRWGVVALDRTSEEILLELRGEGIIRNVYDRFAEFFSACDLMKFARHESDRDSALQLIDLGVRIVEETRKDVLSTPAPEAELEPAVTQASGSDEGGGS